MLKLLTIGLGGFLGAVLRFGLSVFIHRHATGSFPFGTLAVNTAGCLVMGAVLCLVEERQLFSPETRLFLIVGLLGSFTTFSAVGFDTFALLRAGEPRMAVVNAAANMGLGIAAVAVGWIGVKATGA